MEAGKENGLLKPKTLAKGIHTMSTFTANAASVLSAISAALCTRFGSPNTNDPTSWTVKNTTAFGDEVKVNISVNVAQKQVVVDDDGNAWSENQASIKVASPDRLGVADAPARVYARASLLAETAALADEVEQELGGQFIYELLQTKEERENAMKANMDRRNFGLAQAILTAHLKDECKHMRLGVERAFTDELLAELALGSVWRIELGNKVFSMKVTGVGTGATVTRLA